jgi:hypothetical protein
MKIVTLWLAGAWFNVGASHISEASQTPSKSPNANNFQRRSTKFIANVNLYKKRYMKFILVLNSEFRYSINSTNLSSSQPSQLWILKKFRYLSPLSENKVNLRLVCFVGNFRCLLTRSQWIMELVHANSEFLPSLPCVVQLPGNY